MFKLDLYDELKKVTGVYFDTVLYRKKGKPIKTLIDGLCTQIPKLYKEDNVNSDTKEFLENLEGWKTSVQELANPKDKDDLNENKYAASCIRDLAEYIYDFAYTTLQNQLKDKKTLWADDADVESSRSTLIGIGWDIKSWTKEYVNELISFD